MSRLRVETSLAVDHAHRLAAIAPELERARTGVTAGDGAGAGTSAAGVIDHATGHVAASLVAYGRAAEALRRLMVAAAVEYARAEAAIRESAR